MFTRFFGFTGLWRNPDFLKLWTAQTVSQVGSLIRFIALPLTAISTVGASPFEIGVLMAISGLPSLLIAPLVGVYVDRNRRRPLLIASDWLRAVVIAAIPIAYFLDSLHLWMLYLAALSMGSLSLLFNSAYRSYLPSLVKSDELVEGNSKLEMGRSGAEVAGPGLAGAIIQVASAPVALLADAATFAISAISLHLIKSQEPEPQTQDEALGVWREAANGLRFLWNHSLLRPLFLATAIFGFSNAVLEAAFLIYMSEELDISPGLIGAIFTIGGLGLIVGAAAANRVVVRTGIGVALFLGIAIIAASDLALPAAGGSKTVIVVIVSLGAIGFGLGLPLFNVAQTSISQAVTSNEMRGRVSGAFQLAIAGTVPIGAIIGGLIGEYIGLRETLFIGVAGEIFAAVFVLVSPLGRVKSLPSAWNT